MIVSRWEYRTRPLGNNLKMALFSFNVRSSSESAHSGGWPRHRTWRICWGWWWCGGRTSSRCTLPQLRVRWQSAVWRSATVCVRLPDLPQHLDGQRQGALVALEGESLVDPGLAEVAVHDVALWWVSIICRDGAQCSLCSPCPSRISVPCSALACSPRLGGWDLLRPCHYSIRVPDISR